MATVQDLVDHICEAFNSKSNPKEALAMQKYMKDHFNFYGIKSPERKSITSAYIKEFKSVKPLDQKTIIDLLWQKNERECQYAAMDFAAAIERKMDDSWLPFWVKKIQEKSWWDTVDFIASHSIGTLLINQADNADLAWQWTEDKNMWLQRTAIIFQLKYKSKTNAGLLFDLITAQAANKEFFIRKACGWALREYGKTNGLAVSEFINNNRTILSNLTIKEGERLLYK
jgi:3-methyladenine DNA glycosylase AlkD